MYWVFSSGPVPAPLDFAVNVGLAVIAASVTTLTPLAYVLRQVMKRAQPEARRPKLLVTDGHEGLTRDLAA